MRLTQRVDRAGLQDPFSVYPGASRTKLETRIDALDANKDRRLVTHSHWSVDEQPHA